MVSITYGHGFCDDCNNMWSNTGGTADSGNTTTTVDTERTEADGYWLGYYIKFTSGDNAGLYRLITGYVTGTVTHLAFPNNVDAGDTYVLSSWKQNFSGMTSSQVYLYCENDNEFKIKGVADASANEYTYIEKAINNLNSSVYTKYYVGWKTGTSANALGLDVKLVFSDASTQDIVGTSSVPVFSALWTMSSGLITPNKTITAVRVYADDNPNTLADGIPYYVWTDFILLCKGTFTIPNVAYGLDVYLPPRDATITIPGRVTDVIQALGSESATVTLSSDLNHGEWKRTGDYVDAEVFYDIAHNSYREPFQWLDTGSERFKVWLEGSPRVRRESDGKQTTRTLDLTFREYAPSTLTGSPPTVISYIERFGLNL